MDTTIYRAVRLAYRLGRQDQQRILEHRLRKDLGADAQAKQIAELAAGMTDELVNFQAIILAAEKDSTEFNSLPDDATDVGLGGRGGVRMYHDCECGMERIPVSVAKCSACEVADRAADALAAMRAERDAALARAEQAERERDEARADGERERARAAVVVWGLAVADWRVWRVDQRWVYHVPFAALETDPVITCPRLTDSPLADITDEIVDAIAATHGCPESLRVGWRGVRGC